MNTDDIHNAKKCKQLCLITRLTHPVEGDMTSHPSQMVTVTMVIKRWHIYFVPL